MSVGPPNTTLGDMRGEEGDGRFLSLEGTLETSDAAGVSQQHRGLSEMPSRVIDECGQVGGEFTRKSCEATKPSESQSAIHEKEHVDER